MIDTTLGFTLVREFSATPAEMWRYWTEPAAATRWMHPRGVSTPLETIRFDVRPGGTYQYMMVNDETGERYPTGGVFREVIPNKRIVFTWGKPDDDPEDCPLITVTLEPTATGTRMTFDLRGVPAKPSDDIYVGWEEALDCLGEQVAERKEHRWTGARCSSYSTRTRTPRNS